MMNNTYIKAAAGLAALITALSVCAGCADNNSDISGKKSNFSITREAVELTTEDSGSSPENMTAQKLSASYTENNNGIIDTADLFSDRDLEQEPDLSEAVRLTVSDGKTIDITEEGIYVLSGSAENCTVKVNADKEAKVQLVLDGVQVENEDFPAVYVLSADKVFVTSVSDSSLAVNGSFNADGETNTDAVIYSKDDLVFNGTGTLDIYSAYGNGISCKDDLKFTGGTYNIAASADAVEANDSIAICGGEFTIQTNKDGFHSENEEDDSLGCIYIADGSFSIDAASDGIQGTSCVQIDGGTFNITSAEGIEATYVQINGGNITIDASDDGINASRKSSAYDVTIEFNGGETTITMGQGDTDGVDSNGSIYVNGGTINVTAQMSSFDYDEKAEFNGGTIIVNGEEVDEIPQSMMGGPMGGHGGFGGQAPPEGFGGRGGRF
ncbi:carbohydrate-binding domain-containing protein [uncultured Ruminococcus sp.]|uniref:carbohydrate-binding domain-containing protein n=1 Tax=uncultured Ruminococcus sp. TaxID=165186 RepID=UPI00261C14B4|nr:carbohydrate-binding domain-containing protein [uncultured Ruminococcus sp.]